MYVAYACLISLDSKGHGHMWPLYKVLSIHQTSYWMTKTLHIVCEIQYPHSRMYQRRCQKPNQTKRQVHVPSATASLTFVLKQKVNVSIKQAVHVESHNYTCSLSLSVCVCVCVCSTYHYIYMYIHLYSRACGAMLAFTYFKRWCIKPWSAYSLHRL